MFAFSMTFVRLNLLNVSYHKLSNKVVGPKVGNITSYCILLIVVLLMFDKLIAGILLKEKYFVCSTTKKKKLKQRLIVTK